MNKPYKCKEIEPTSIPRHCLRTAEKLGSSHLGKVSIVKIINNNKKRTYNKIYCVPKQAIVCEGIGLDKVVSGAVKLMVARIPLVNSETSNVSPSERLREVKLLTGLSDPNLARFLGICPEAPDPWTIVEYTELGDLAHYLQYSVPLTGTLRPSCNLKAIRYFQITIRRFLMRIKVTSDFFY